MRAELSSLNHCAVPFLSRPRPTFAGSTVDIISGQSALFGATSLYNIVLRAKHT